MTISLNASASLFIALTLTGCIQTVENRNDNVNENQVVNAQANGLTAQTFYGTQNHMPHKQFTF